MISVETTEKSTVSVELTPTELSILVTALGYATGNIDLDAVKPLQRRLLEIYKEVNDAR